MMWQEMYGNGLWTIAHILIVLVSVEEEDSIAMGH